MRGLSTQFIYCLDLITSTYIGGQSKQFEPNTKMQNYILNINHFEVQLASSASNTNSFHTDTNPMSETKSIEAANPQGNSLPQPLSAAGCLSDNNSSRTANERIQLLKRARLIQTNNEFKSIMYVYPKCLKYDQQKSFSKARNILIRTEFRDDDTVTAGHLASHNCLNVN